MTAGGRGIPTKQKMRMIQSMYYFQTAEDFQGRRAVINGDRVLGPAEYERYAGVNMTNYNVVHMLQ